MSGQIDIKDVHWILDIVQCIDVGVIVLNRNYSVEVWNSFMESHSGIGPADAQGKSLFELFPEIDIEWFKRKVETVVKLGTRGFSLWEQRPYLMKFKSYQPITGQAEFMYQNVTFLPLVAAHSEVDHVCVVVYDMTAAAVLKQQLLKSPA